MWRGQAGTIWCVSKKSSVFNIGVHILPSRSVQSNSKRVLSRPPPSEQVEQLPPAQWRSEGAGGGGGPDAAGGGAEGVLKKIFPCISIIFISAVCLLCKYV